MKAFKVLKKIIIPVDPDAKYSIKKIYAPGDIVVLVPSVSKLIPEEKIEYLGDVVKASKKKAKKQEEAAE